MNDAYKAGFDFNKGRWLGTVHKPFAQGVARALVRKDMFANVFTSKDKVWLMGKNEEVEYYRVWVRHPQDIGLYCWWGPNKEDGWSEPFDPDLATWVEFEQEKTAATGAK